LLSSARSDGTLWVAGTGSFALEIIEYTRDAGRPPTGLVELLDQARVGTVVHGLPVVDLAAAPSGATALIGAGGDRLALAERLAAHGWLTASAVVHPAAHCSASAVLDAGAIVGPGAVVGAASALGEHVLIGRGALVGHHVALAEGVILNPGANVGGNTRVGRCAQIGMGATVVNGTTVGARAVVAAGATVVRPVDAGARVQGVPARPFAVTAARLP
jgi:sugar O-acyltransferase (sialic acid O-acetyltransferase NeuD family)